MIPDRGSVFRASTRFYFGDVFAGVEKLEARLAGELLQLRHHAEQVLFFRNPRNSNRISSDLSIRKIDGTWVSPYSLDVG